MSVEDDIRREIEDKTHATEEVIKWIPVDYFLDHFDDKGNFKGFYISDQGTWGRGIYVSPKTNLSDRITNIKWIMLSSEEFKKDPSQHNYYKMILASKKHLFPLDDQKLLSYSDPVFTNPSTLSSNEKIIIKVG